MAFNDFVQMRLRTFECIFCEYYLRISHHCIHKSSFVLIYHCFVWVQCYRCQYFESKSAMIVWANMEWVRLSVVMLSFDWYEYVTRVRSVLFASIKLFICWYLYTHNSTSLRSDANIARAQKLPKIVFLSEIRTDHTLGKTHNLVGFFRTYKSIRFRWAWLIRKDIKLKQTKNNIAETDSSSLFLRRKRNK